MHGFLQSKRPPFCFWHRQTGRIVFSKINSSELNSVIRQRAGRPRTEAAAMLVGVPAVLVLCVWDGEGGYE